MGDSFVEKPTKYVCISNVDFMYFKTDFGIRNMTIITLDPLRLNTESPITKRQ